MRKLYRKLISFSSAGVYLFFQVTNVFAVDGSDILKEPTRDLFATFVGTGIDLMLMMEIGVAAYVFTTKERKLSTWIGLPVVILVTAFAKTKFGG